MGELKVLLIPIGFLNSEIYSVFKYISLEVLHNMKIFRTCREDGTLINVSTSLLLNLNFFKKPKKLFCLEETKRVRSFKEKLKISIFWNKD